MAGTFKPQLAPTAKRRRFTNTHAQELNIRNAFLLRTQVVLGGACVQLLLCAFLPLRWAAVPAATCLAVSVVKTIMETLSPNTNYLMDGVVFGRTTAQLPSEKGVFGPEPGQKGLVVFNLGVQLNHPLGILAPGAKQIIDSFFALIADLEARRQELGVLSISTWQEQKRGSNNALCTSFYFRDLESVHRFAHEDLHRHAWDTYNGNDWKHIGVYHETFVVEPEAYETMYVNCRPLLFGQGMVKCETGGGAQWVNTLVSANTPALKTQYARMSRDEKGVPKR